MNGLERTAAYNALRDHLRWFAKERCTLSPDAFIPIAEFVREWNSWRKSRGLPPRMHTQSAMSNFILRGHAPRWLKVANIHDTDMLVIVPIGWRK